MQRSGLSKRVGHCRRRDLTGKALSTSCAAMSTCGCAAMSTGLIDRLPQSVQSVPSGHLAGMNWGSTLGACQGGLQAVPGCPRARQPASCVALLKPPSAPARHFSREMRVYLHVVAITKQVAAGL